MRPANSWPSEKATLHADAANWVGCLPNITGAIVFSVNHACRPQTHDPDAASLTPFYWVVTCDEAYRRYGQAAPSGHLNGWLTAICSACSSTMPVMEMVGRISRQNRKGIQPSRQIDEAQPSLVPASLQRFYFPLTTSQTPPGRRRKQISFVMAVDTIKHTEAVGKLLKALDENKSLEHLRMMHDENVRLQQEIKTLRFMSDENDKKLAKYVKDIETSREEAKKTGENLQEERRLRRELDSQAKAAQGRVKVIESKLVEATSELSRMQDFRVEMKPLSADTYVLLAPGDAAVLSKLTHSGRIAKSGSRPCLTRRGVLHRPTLGPTSLKTPSRSPCGSRLSTMTVLRSKYHSSSQTPHLRSK